MKFKKKLLSLIAAAAVCVTTVFGLTACGPKTPEPSNILFGKEVVKYTSQADILQQLTTGGCKLGVMDSVMAGYYASTSDQYAKTDIVLSEENYVVAAKKGNVQLINELNEALVALKGEQITEIAKEYGLESELAIDDYVKKDTKDTSFDKIKAKNKLRIGYTLYAPIAFKKGDDLVGFDIQVPEAVVDYWNNKYKSNIEIEFMPISWDQKETMLDNGSIDFAWNGLSWTQEREDNLELSIPYMKNKQVVVCLKADEEKFKTLAAFLENCKDVVVGVEAGSNADDLMNL